MKNTSSELTLSIGADLYLRKASQADASAVFRLIDRHRRYLREWLPFTDYSQDVSDTALFLQTVTAGDTASDLVFVIVYLEEVVGLIGFKAIDDLNRKLEIGYWLAEDRQGKGIMRRSCTALVSYAFGELGINRIQIKVGVGNHRSSNIPKKLGFLLEGIQREGEYLNGKFHDLEVYSLLQHEWQEQQ